jgi:hypothetical protein
LKYDGEKLPVSEARRAALLESVPADIRAEYEDAYAALTAFEKGAGVTKNIGRQPLRLGDLPGVSKGGWIALDLRLMKAASMYRRAAPSQVPRPGQSDWDWSDIPDRGPEPDKLYTKARDRKKLPIPLVWLQPDEKALLSESRGTAMGIAFSVWLVFGIIGAPLVWVAIPTVGPPLSMALLFGVPYLVYRGLLARARHRLRNAPKVEKREAFMASALAPRGRPPLESAARWAAHEAGLPPARPVSKFNGTPAGGFLNVMTDFGGVHQIWGSSTGLWGNEFIMIKSTELSTLEAHRKLKGLILREVRAAWERPSVAAVAETAQEPPSQRWRINRMEGEGPRAPPFVQCDLEMGPDQRFLEVADRIGATLHTHHPRLAPLAAKSPEARKWGEVGDFLVVELSSAPDGRCSLRVQGSMLEEEQGPLLKRLEVACLAQ